MSETSTQSDFCIYSYDFEKNGNAINAKKAGVSNNSLLTWWHLDATHEGSEDYLRNSIKLNPVIAHALVDEDTRPRIESFEDGLMVILRGINTLDPDHPEEMVSLRIWIDEKRIITLRRRKLKTIEDLANHLEKNTRSLKTSADILSYIIDKLLTKIEPVIDDLAEDCDEHEEAIIDNPEAGQRSAIAKTRKKSITLRRYLAPQRDALNQLRNVEYPFINKQNTRSFQESSSTVTRLIEDIDMLRERTQIIQDELTNTLSDRLNRNMYILSVIAAIFLPLGFLTGLLGINVGGIPGSENPMAFWIFMAMLAVIVIGQVILFKKMKWF